MDVKRLAVLIIFLICVGCSSIVTAFKKTVPMFTKHYPSVAHKRMLRVYDSTKNEVESRANIGSIAAKINERFILKGWVANKMSGIEVLNTLNVGNTLETTLKSGELEMLVKYVTRFNKDKLPTDRISAVGTLMQRYEDDAVLQAIARLKEVDDTKNIATMLKADVALNYVAIFKGKVNQNDMVKKLMDDVGAKSILDMIGAANQRLLAKNSAQELKELETKVLVAHLNSMMATRRMEDKLESVLFPRNLVAVDSAISQLNPNFPDPFLRVLTTKYGDRAVAKGLPGAISNTATKDIVIKLQNQQYQTWSKGKKSVDDVYRLLGLHGYGDMGLVTNAGLSPLLGYIMLSRREKPALKVFISKLSSQFGGEDKFALYLQSAIEMDDAAALKVKKLQEKLFRKWENDKLYPDSVITKIFKVTTGTPKPMMSRIVDRYNTFLKKKHE